MDTTVDVERPHPLHARLVVVGLVLALAVLLLPGRAMAAPADDPATAVGLINQARADYGLGGLTQDPELQALADRQANRMADAGYLFHTSRLGDRLSAGWWAWAENVGYGSSVEWVHGAFMNSDLHSANILDPTYDYVGVGVAYGSDGSVYVSEIFGAW